MAREQARVTGRLSVVIHGFTITLAPAVGVALNDYGSGAVSVVAVKGDAVCWCDIATGLYDAERKIRDAGFYLTAPMPTDITAQAGDYATVSACLVG
jgi:hypothetical protein